MTGPARCERLGLPWRRPRWALPTGLLLALFIAPAFLGAAANWPQFRGPNGDGHSDAGNLPLTWSEAENIRWKTAIHGRAWASPVIWGEQIWLSSAAEDGTQLFAICVDRDTGAIVHDLKMFDVATPQFAHKFNTYASPTPVIEEGRIYITFGSPGTACLDTRSGRVLWERRDFECNHYRGAGSSPILHGNLLILNFDGSDHQFVVALDKRTGETVWRKERSIDFQDVAPDGKPMTEGDLRKAFSTPHIVPLYGATVLISSGAKAHYAYVPATGEELWRVEERACHSASTRPVVGDGLIFIPAGFPRGILLAIDPGSERPQQKVVDADDPPSGPASQLHVAWRQMRNIPNKPSILFADGLLFMVDDGGIASCLEAKTGKEIWRERVGGNHSASPLLAGGRIYFFNEEGKTSVVAAGREFRVLAENQLGDGFMGSPAVTGNALILRSRTQLYRIEEPERR